MRFPLSMTAGMAGYIARNKLRPRPEWQKDAAGEGRTRESVPDPATDAGRGSGAQPHPMIGKRFPLVLMLEPLHACNLTCTGCGRIREYESTITRAAAAGGVPGGGGRVRRADRLDLRRRAADVSARSASWSRGHPGAEQAHLPLHQRHVHPEAARASSRRTAASSSTSTWTAWRRRTTCAWSAKGVFREAIEGIKAAKAAGFKVCTNTTVYKETDMREIEALFEYLEQFDVDGHQLSPAYGYSAVNDREIFMTRDDIHEKFKDIDRLAERFRLNQHAGVPGVPARASASCPARRGATRPTTSRAGRAPAT